jgi:3-deoxy-D-manno-octulosonic-acid transferase
MGELLGRPESIDSLGTLAHNAVRQVSGASDRNVDALARLLPVHGSAGVSSSGT